MTYEEAMKSVKSIPLNDVQTLRKFIFSLKEQVLIDKVCAKWFAVVCKELKYEPDTEAPQEYGMLVEALTQRNEVWRAYNNNPAVKMYIQTKMMTNARNMGNYERIKQAIDLLDESEIKAHNELKDKLLEFINGTTKEVNRAFPGYEYPSKFDLRKYNIKPEGIIPKVHGDIQRDVRERGGERRN